ncbi:MAG: metal-sulfur cluster assembly factor [Gammaproteobacteria bacterium]
MTDTAVTEKIVRDALRQVIDPEVGVNIVDLGLVYGIEATADRIDVVMTMTTPTCPMGAHVTDNVRHVLRALAPQIADIRVRLVWDPPWSPDRMSSEAKSRLGW